MARRNRPRVITKAQQLPAGATTYTPEQVAEIAVALAGKQSATAATARPLPPLDLGALAFSPGNPLTPVPINAVRPDTGRPEPRAYEYPVSVNLPGFSDRLVPWRTLRDAADGISMFRKCIEVRKNEVATLEWDIVISERAVERELKRAGGTARADLQQQMQQRLEPEIGRMVDFWEEPDRRNGLDWIAWAKKALEERLVLDALAIYPRRTYGGDVYSLEILDGSTIKPLLDEYGGRPLPPHAAYQQVLYGFPRGDFIADTIPDEQLPGGYHADQLIYEVDNVRTFTPYGYSAVERALIDGALYLQRNAWMLAEYTDGVMPSGWLLAGQGQADWSPTQLTEYERILNDYYAGITAARQRLRILPYGMTPHESTSVPEKYKPDYDLHLIKLVSGHFDTTLAELGFTEQGGLGSTGWHEGQADVQDRKATQPTLRALQALVTKISRRNLGMPRELEFKILGQESEDAGAADEVADRRVKGGRMTLNEDRDRLGLSRWPFPEADKPFIIGGDGGITFIEGAAERAEQAARAAIDAQQQPDVDGEVVDSSEDEDAEPSEMAKTELAAYRRWARKNLDPARPFRLEHATPAMFGGDVPAGVEFADWVYIVEVDGITKAYEAWWPRDAKGRWVKRGHLSDVMIGPERPSKKALAGLRSAGAHVEAPAPGKRTRPGDTEHREFDEHTVTAETRRTALQASVRDSVAALEHRNRGGWVGLADVRDDLDGEGYSRAEQDVALRGMLTQPDVRIITVADRKNVSERDRAAALDVGGVPNYTIQIGGDREQREREAAKGVGELDLSSALASGVASERALSGGEAGETQLITFKDGTWVIKKKIVEDMGGWSPKEQADAEELATYVAAALDVQAPKAKRISKDTLYLGYVPGKTARETHGKGVPDAILSSDQGVRMGLLDHITNNTDRHSGNWVMNDDGIAAIDNGMMFNYSTTIGHNPFGKAHFDEDTPNSLTPEDVAAVRSRLEALEPKFREMRRLGWHRKMMSQLNEVERNASGKRDLYASVVQAAPTPKKKLLGDERGVAARLASATSREQANELLSGMTKAQLRELAREKSVPVLSAATVTQLKSALVSVLVGTRLDADAISRRSVAKADDADPKVPPPPDQRWPAWQVDEDLAAAYETAILTALAAGLTTTAAAALATDWLAAVADGATDPATWLAGRGLNIAGPLTDVLTDLYTEAYMVGARSAAAVVEHMPVRLAVEVTVDWGAWTPGDVDAARLILTTDGRTGGLQQLLDQAGIVIKSIAQHRLDELAAVLADGVEQGKSPDEIGRAIQGLVGNKARAYMIAVTETNRAISAASVDEYRESGIVGKEWMTALDQDVCPACKANVTAGVVGVDDDFPSGDPHPPGHPHCRCAVIPALDIDLT